MGPRFWGPKIASFLIFFFAKTLFFTWAKTCTCWLSKQPFCTNMHKNLLGIELRWHEGKIIRILDLTSGTAPSQKLVLNCFALGLGLWGWYQWLYCCQNFRMHFVSSFGPSIYHTARYTIQGCDCMSMQQLSCNNFWMLLPTFFSFFGAPFLGPIFGPHFWRPVPF